MNVQLVTPDLEVKGIPGFCLGMQQRVWGAPARYATAWDAWENVTQQTGTVPEDICTLLWFDHWGTYGGVYGRYGHVVTYVPGRGLLSNPGRGSGQLWYDTIQACEKDCNATYVGWSADINGLQIAQITNNIKKGTADMATVYYKTESGKTTYALAGDGTGKAAWLETQDVALATALVAAHHISQTAVKLSPDTYALWKKNYTNA